MKIEMSKMLLASGIRDIILYELSNIDSLDKNACVFYNCFQNGREQGFTINVYNNQKIKSITISENRNSDHIVVYLDNFENQGLNEKSYNSAKYFQYGEYSEAINFCKNYLINP